MAEIIANVPAKIQIKNTSDLVKVFVPYKENFTTALAAKSGIEFEVQTAGQVLYFLNQATDGLEVKVIDAFTADDETIKKLNVPAKVTLTNVGEEVVGFVPYRENFQFDIEKDGTVELTATTAGQVLYYLAQGIADKLTVEQEEA